MMFALGLRHDTFVHTHMVTCMYIYIDDTILYVYISRLLLINAGRKTFLLPQRRIQMV